MMISKRKATEEMKKQQQKLLIASSADQHEFKSHSMSGNSEATEAKGNIRKQFIPPTIYLTSSSYLSKLTTIPMACF